MREVDVATHCRGIDLESFEIDRSPSGAMMTWLAEDLAANTMPWTIAFWHHPPYSKGSHDSDVEEQLGLRRGQAEPARSCEVLQRRHQHVDLVARVQL